jgi:hypothetical protein
MMHLKYSIIYIADVFADVFSLEVVLAMIFTCPSSKCWIN